MEKASHCREEREKQLKVFGQLKKKGKKWVGGTGELTHSHNTPQNNLHPRTHTCLPSELPTRKYAMI